VGYLRAVAGVEDGVGEGAIGFILDGLPAVVEEIEEVPEDRGGLLPGEAQSLHGVKGTACPLPGSHPLDPSLYRSGYPLRHSGKAEKGILGFGMSSAACVVSTAEWGSWRDRGLSAVTAEGSWRGRRKGNAAGPVYKQVC
jgi:hypothetical protein